MLTISYIIMPAYANIYEISYYAQNYVSLVCQFLVNSYIRSWRQNETDLWEKMKAQ